MTNLELFSLTPLLSFSCLPSELDGFPLDGDKFQILTWTAGGHYKGREFVVVGCRSSLDNEQQYLIIRSIHEGPRRREKSPKKIRDLNKVMDDHIDDNKLSMDDQSNADGVDKTAVSGYIAVPGSGEDSSSDEPFQEEKKKTKFFFFLIKKNIFTKFANLWQQNIKTIYYYFFLMKSCNTKKKKWTL
ncbi:hypothetical protein RFI_15699 [Reticulomyxa filosa]|uniref:Uncharacterized protein n=1 Tax=Reticulomyxa filosa TaxID=46433 RepID=X6N6F0_RETFI|nr:hypothetical protein RFI_15699 [Reticulomyxa filosa]|eukprot:ETO21503.1 hypothetical protein RFI_15699 [Reticulomyxa filosa]